MDGAPLATLNGSAMDRLASRTDAAHPGIGQRRRLRGS